MWHSYWLTCLITLTPGPQKTISARWSTYSFCPFAKAPPPPSPLRLPAMPLVLPFAWIKKRLLCFPSPCFSPRQHTESEFVGLMKSLCVCVSGNVCDFLHLNQHVEFRRWTTPVPFSDTVVFVFTVHLKILKVLQNQTKIDNTTQINIQALLIVLVNYDRKLFWLIPRIQKHWELEATFFVKKLLLINPYVAKMWYFLAVGLVVWMVLSSHLI